MNNLTIILNFFSAFIISSGTAFGCVLIGSSPTKWQIVGCIVAGLVVASKDTRSLLKLPPVDDANDKPKPPPVPIIFLIGALSLWGLAGCVQLQPGADPLVVRAEQLETTATASFDLVVSVDGSERAFWATNAPAFHQFAEWLRTPIMETPNPNERRGLALILQLDDAKAQYLINKSSSNALLKAISDLSFAESQASAWATIIKTPTPK